MANLVTPDHNFFMKAALEQATVALNQYEVPVGCVFVYNNDIIGAGFNQTNITRNVGCPFYI